MTVAVMAAVSVLWPARTVRVSSSRGTVTVVGANGVLVTSNVFSTETSLAKVSLFVFVAAAMIVYVPAAVVFGTLSNPVLPSMVTASDGPLIDQSTTGFSRTEPVLSMTVAEYCTVATVCSLVGTATVSESLVIESVFALTTVTNSVKSSAEVLTFGKLLAAVNPT